MNKAIKGMLFCSIVFLVVAGCANLGTIKPEKKVLCHLDYWIDAVALKEIVHKLKNDSFFKAYKDSSFIIVKANGEKIENKIDPLTEDLRQRFELELRKYPEIDLGRKHPASRIDRPYTLQNIECDTFAENRLLLTIDIKKVGAVKEKYARVAIGAIDSESGKWVKGFSVYNNQVILSKNQESALLAEPKPDEYLRGTKYAPFTSKDQDDMAAYLANNLSCIFKKLDLGRDNLTVHVDESKLGGHDRNIIRLIEKQLNYCNEIQRVDTRKNADLILDAEMISSGAGMELSQLWLEVYQKDTGAFAKGFTTYAYYLNEEIHERLTGIWEIRSVKGHDLEGQLRISKTENDEYLGSLFDSSGALLQPEIIIHVNKNIVTWRYYDRNYRAPYDVKGVLSDDSSMAVAMSRYPFGDEVKYKKLVLFR